MTTIIDSLLIEVSLDASKLTKGQQEAINQLRDLEEQAHKGAVGTETSSKRIIGALGGIKTQALELFSVFTGGVGAAVFIKGLTTADAAIGRVSRSTGVSAEMISKWSVAARLLGGDAASMAAEFIKFNDAFVGFLNGFGDPKLYGKLAGLSRKGGIPIDPSQGPDATFVAIADNLKAIHDRELSGKEVPGTAGAIGREIGIGDAAFLDLLLRGGKFTRQTVDQVRGHATKESTEDAGQLVKNFNQMVTATEALVRGTNAIWALAKIFGSIAELILPSEAFKNDHPTLGKIDAFFGKINRFLGISKDEQAVSPTSGTSSIGAFGVPGNSRGERNNNRGNIKYGSFAAAHGATGQDEKGFAVFPSTEVGDAAQQALLKTSAYQNLTLAQFASKYAEGSQAWAQTVGQNLGIGLNDRVDASDPRLPSAIRKAEGTNGRSIGALPATTNVNINGPITVTGIKDAADFTNKLRDRGLKLQQEASKSPQGGQ